MKGQVYQTAIGPVILYGLETLAQRRRQKAELEIAKIKNVEVLFRTNTDG